MLIVKDTSIYTMEEGKVVRGDLLIVDGKIKEIGQDLRGDCQLIDGRGLITLPGFIDCHSHVGGMNFSHERDHDSNEMTRNITPDLNMIYGTDPRSEDFLFAREAGITTLGLTPGSGNVICGVAFAAKTYGDNIFDMCISEEVGLKVALGGNPKGTYGSRNQLPSTRMGVAKVLKDYLTDGKKYIDGKTKGREIKDNRDFNILEKVFKKEIPLRIHCTQFDILTAIEIAQEFDLDFSLEHCWGAQDYLEELRESKAEVVYGPLGSIKAFGELRLIDIETVKILDERGVRVSITTDAPLNSIDSLIHHLGEVVRSGVKPERALEMITINPAKVLRLEDRIGSIRPGKDGDLVIFDKLPGGSTDAKVLYTVIDGEIVYKG